MRTKITINFVHRFLNKFTSINSTLNKNQYHDRDSHSLLFSPWLQCQEGYGFILFESI